MTVTTTTASQTFQGNSIATAFPCTFEIFLSTDVNVFFVDPTTGIQTPATLNSDYTITGAGASNGFTVNTTVPVPTGTNLYVVRALPLTQPTDFTNEGAFFPNMHEAAMDRLCMLIQQIANYSEGLNVTMPPGLVPQPSTLFPVPAPGSLIGWNVGGTGLTNVGSSGVGAGSIADVNVAGNAAIASTKLSNTQTGTGAVARTLQAKFGERVSVLDFGADPTGVADATAAFNAALTASNDVFVPPGTYLLGDAVTMTTGQRLRGAGRRKTILHMPSTFNASASGMLAFSGGEPGPTVESLCITQDQPDSVTPTTYPPAIYAQNCPRFSVRFCRIAGVYDGVDMKGNSGGVNIFDLEMSALHIGIDIDGALDTVRISKLHYWPFAGAAASMLTANQKTAMLSATGINSARCDGLQISDSLFLGSRAAVNLYSSVSGFTFGNIIGCDFDSNGGLVAGGGCQLEVASTLFTLGDTGGVLANLSSRFVLFTGCCFAPAVVATAGSYIPNSGNAVFSGCTFLGAALDCTLVNSTAGQLAVVGCLIEKDSGAYTHPLLAVSGTTVGSMTGCYVSPGTSGKLATIAADNGFSITGNVAPNWTVTMPSGTAPNTLVAWNVGPARADDYAGYFSSDGTTTLKLPPGWTVSRLSTGNYNITHNLGLTNANDLMASLTADGTAAGVSAQIDMANTTANIVRVRCYVGATATDCGVFFRFKRYRS